MKVNLVLMLVKYLIEVKSFVEVNFGCIYMFEKIITYQLLAINVEIVFTYLLNIKFIFHTCVNKVFIFFFLQREDSSKI